MNMDLISKRTRNEFRETLVAFVLREIEMFFEGAGLSKNEDYVPPMDGARRSLVEQYYIVVDFSSPSDIKKLLSVYGEIVISLERNGVNESTRGNLLRLMKRDGYDFDGDTFVPLPSKQQPLVDTIQSLAASFDLPALRDEINRLTRAADEDPALAVGTAKEMVETICKTILQDREVPHQAKISHSSSELRPRNSPSYPKAFLTTPRVQR